MENKKRITQKKKITEVTEIIIIYFYFETLF